MADSPLKLRVHIHGPYNSRLCLERSDLASRYATFTEAMREATAEEAARSPEFGPTLAVSGIEAGRWCADISNRTATTAR